MTRMTRSTGTGIARRPLLAALACATLTFFAAGAAHAQAWPARQPIKMIVGLAAGTITDQTTRFFAETIREGTGQTVVIENKPGADSNLAAEIVAHSPADGYTALVAGNNTHAANIHLYKKLNFDPYKDFVPVATFARVPYVLLIHPDRVPARNLKDFIAYAKANPGKLNYGSATVAGRVAVEQLKLLAGFDATNVNYKGSPQAMADLVSGQLDFYMSDISTGLVQVRSGRVIALAITVKDRMPAAPDIPTIAELGFPNYDFFSWLAVWLPTGSPPEAVHTMNELINKAMTSPAGAEYLVRRGLLPATGTPADLQALQTRATETWGRAIKAAGLQAQ